MNHWRNPWTSLLATGIAAISLSLTAPARAAPKAPPRGPDSVDAVSQYVHGGTGAESSAATPPMLATAADPTSAWARSAPVELESPPLYAGRVLGVASRTPRDAFRGLSPNTGIRVVSSR